MFVLIRLFWFVLWLRMRRGSKFWVCLRCEKLREETPLGSWTLAKGWSRYEARTFRVLESLPDPECECGQTMERLTREQALRSVWSGG